MSWDDAGRVDVEQANVERVIVEQAGLWQSDTKQVDPELMGLDQASCKTRIIPEGLVDKYEQLKELLASLGSACVAFSAGVDSTLLLSVAREVLGDSIEAVTLSSQAVQLSEVEAARVYCSSLGIKHTVLTANLFDIEGFAENGPERCYCCKNYLFGNLVKHSQAAGMNAVVEGSNTDDLSDYRPGMRAIAELGVKSPLLDAGFSKSDVRCLSAALGLPTALKPSTTCLATRFEYGMQITPELLQALARIEDALAGAGFSQVRVRAHGRIARIEVASADLQDGRKVAELVGGTFRKKIVDDLKEAGFDYVTLDLEGYSQGSMNRMLDL
jgi:uncharacterized protein